MIDVGDVFDDFRGRSDRFVRVVKNVLCLIIRVLFRHGGEVLRDHAFGIADGLDLSMVEPECAVAQGFHVAGGMRDKKNRDAARAQLVNFTEAALPEIDVADRESFIDQQDFGIDVDRHRECEPDHHAARIGLHRLMDEIADFREFRDVGEFMIHCLRGDAQDRGVQIDVIAARKFRIESGAQFEESRHPSADFHAARAGLQDAGADLQQRALAAAILPHQAERLAAAHFESDIAQGPVVLMKPAPVKCRDFFQTVARSGVDGVALGNVRKFDGGGGH